MAATNDSAHDSGDAEDRANRSGAELQRRKFTGIVQVSHGTGSLSTTEARRHLEQTPAAFAETAPMPLHGGLP